MNFIECMEPEIISRHLHVNRASVNSLFDRGTEDTSFSFRLAYRKQYRQYTFLQQFLKWYELCLP